MDDSAKDFGNGYDKAVLYQDSCIGFYVSMKHEKNMQFYYLQIRW